MSEATSAPEQPSEQELRAAYEAELSRITSADLIVQTAASLLNLGARRLGLAGPPSSETEPDLEQVRDAIDGVRGLLPVLERRTSTAELAPLRDALSQLQMAYAQQAQRSAPDSSVSNAAAAPAANPGGAAAPEPDAPQPGQSSGPGPAESSGRLWVPDR